MYIFGPILADYDHLSTTYSVGFGLTNLVPSRLKIICRSGSLLSIIQRTIARVKFNNMFDGLAGISKAEGRQGLYKGLKPACLATLPSTGCSYVVYEYAKGIFGIGSAT